ncbi:MAG: hypothetical protein PHR83_09340 [Paludibacter sp.]|nr:hypothetical protein [Paludibacter sp.]
MSIKEGQYRIAIIIPYFGEWPEWIDLYFYSCAQNHGIDWYFYTDCSKESFLIADNLFFYSITFADYCALISKSLGIEFKPISAYKLCDIKPFLGFIHKDILTSYQFWGFGDIDVVWGNIRAFYTNKVLEKFDVFSTHNDRLSGHLAILRNIKRINELCFNIKEWQNKLELNQNFVLDETDFSDLLYPPSKYIRKFYGKIICHFFNWRDAWLMYYNIMPVVNLIFMIKLRRLYFREQHTTPILSDDRLTFKHDADTWYYKQGNITNSKTMKKYIYMHFMIFKKNSFKEDYFWKGENYLLSHDNSFEGTIVIDKKGIYTI